MERVLRSSTFRILSRSPAGVKTDVRVRLDYMHDVGKPVLRWSGSESVCTQKVCLCDVLDFHFYMSDRKEKLKYGKEATLPSVHYMAKGKRIPGFEVLGRLPPITKQSLKKNPN